MYAPITTVLSENASITGKPATVLTEKSESDRSSEISNNLPLFPSIAKIVVLAVEPDPSTMSTSAPPTTFSLADGFVVPIPTNCVEVAVSTESLRVALLPSALLSNAICSLPLPNVSPSFSMMRAPFL